MYADLAFANAYFAERLHTSAWDNALVVDRNKALAMATRDIDRLDFIGSKVEATQENEFPRAGQTEVPDDIKIAACEIALELLNGIDPAQELEAAKVIADKYGTVGTTYLPSSTPEHVFAMIASARAWTYLKPFLRDSRCVRLSRVS